MRSPRLALALLVAACSPAGAPHPTAAVDDADGLLRELAKDGKFDELGHPLNAQVYTAAALCHGRGRKLGDSWVVDAQDGAGAACQGSLGRAPSGELTLNVRVRADSYRPGPIVKITATVADAPAEDKSSITLSDATVRAPGQWMNLVLPVDHFGNAEITLAVEAFGNGVVELADLELFPRQFDLVLGPGSSELADSDEITIELPRNAAPERVRLDADDVSARFAQLIAQARVRVEKGELRTLYHARVDDLADGRTGALELLVEAGESAARMEIRREKPACRYEGDPHAPVKALVTGFQPFPADADHENISAVAVSSARPSEIPGVQLMRLVLPVEYDRAAGEVAEAIARCAPDFVVSFGQGSGLRLERTAYNLRDSSEVVGGGSDNRGIIASARPIVAGEARTRATRLPLDAMRRALTAIEESPDDSDDPGRYICNDVMFGEVGAVDGTARLAGFVHLPFETAFPEPTRLRWGRVVEAIVRAVAATLPPPPAPAPQAT
jgi:pyroglutamyl-peptidase